MLAALVVVLRTVALICCGHRAVALENLALRQQLAVFRRTAERPPLPVVRQNVVIAEPVLLSADTPDRIRTCLN